MPKREAAKEDATKPAPTKNAPSGIKSRGPNRSKASPTSGEAIGQDGETIDRFEIDGCD